MSATPFPVVATEPARRSGPAWPLRHLWASWRSLRREELSWFLLMAMFYGLVDVSSISYVMDDPRWPQALARQLLTPLPMAAVALLAWLPATRSAQEHRLRWLRLGLSTLIGSVLAMGAYATLMPLLDWPSVADLARGRKDMDVHPPPLWIHFVGESLSVFVPSLLSVALYEVVHRRRRTRERLQRQLRTHGTMTRQAMATRLSALQAQVEPQFLFDTLVDIEQAHARADPAAAEQMERLIRHLRVALPRLRESGGTLESESALLDSYLAVVAGRHRRPLALSTDWPAQLAQAPLPPMLLLPLAQLVLKAGDTPPGHATLAARTLDAGGLHLRLVFDRGGLCDESALRTLSERLAGLAGAPARLHCRSTADETEFTLELPA